MDHGLADILEIRSHNEFFVIPRRGLVAAAGVHYGDEASVIPLQVAISKSQLSHEFHAPDFEPDKVIGMIDHSHLIGLSVAYAYPALADHTTVVAPRAHWPLQRGLRFSRNE